MPRIIRAEFLSYYNSRRNSDKLFNVFVVEDDDGSFSCIAERGRRGTRLVRDVLCDREDRYVAEGKMRQKVFAKRNQRETPYTDETFGSNYSQLAREYGYSDTRGETAGTNQTSQATPVRTAVTMPRKENVIEFPSEKKVKPRQQPKQSGILNQEQFDSLEI
jgi:hypothetical protein